MRIRRLEIENFRGIRMGSIDFNPHTLLVGGNNVGKSTICEALDLLLGPERGYRHPVVDEHDFTDGAYRSLNDAAVPEIRIKAVMTGLSDEEKRTVAWGHLRAWDDPTGAWLDEQPGGLEAVDDEGSELALPLIFLARYDPEEDSFIGDTYFDHPAADQPDDPSADARTRMSGGRTVFSRRLKRMCGFVYLRALRTGSRALSLQRGSLLDTILRLSEEGSAEMWAETLTRLHDLEPSIGDIPQLRSILTQVRTEVNHYIQLAPSESATAFFASDLTREHMREVVKLFIASQPSGHPVPFNRQGTGALNMLVFALLTMIAELKGKQSVIFAMEEPEIALPPHTQRLVTRHVLREMGQTVVTSHSPYVIEQFEMADIVVLANDGQRVTGTPINPGLLRRKLYWKAKREFAEAILSRAVLIVEGDAEVAAFHAASSVLELHEPEYQHLDLAGVSVIGAGNDSSVPLFAPIFRAMGKRTYGTWDKPKSPLSDEAQEASKQFDRCWPSSEIGLEDLLVKEAPVSVHRDYLEKAANRADYPEKASKYTPELDDDAVGLLARETLKARKGDGYAALLIESCVTLDDIPASIREILHAINDDLKPIDLAATLGATAENQPTNP